METQVNDVRRETAGSHRFPVNSGDRIQNRFLCPFPAYFLSIPALGYGDRIRLPFPERFRNADPIVFTKTGYGSYPAVYRIRIRLFFYGDKIRTVSCRL